ncbi:hypothetical protein OGZ44_12715 [Lactococcus lactis]|uniref:hypothetical protein n=1 Tax=Lactococcus lactis TaxID=1358 RepID=UPI002416B515|nr:hypothetical protein [Lactococcus lactis]MDG4975106.1 hypothetical protein [Lactococcus lactis]
MKTNSLKRQSGYTSNLASQIVDASKSIHSLSLELTPQFKFIDKVRTEEVVAYKAWFAQSGLPPFEVKFEKNVKLPDFLALVTFEELQACEVGYNVYFKALNAKEVK